MQPMQVDSGKATVDNIVQIGDVNVVVKETSKIPIMRPSRSSLLPRNLLWLMIMRPAAVALQANIINLGGACQV